MSFKIPCGGFMLGEGLVLSEDGKTLSVSGGGLPSGGAPYQQLVTDGDDNTKWEDRLAYEGSKLTIDFIQGYQFVKVSDEIPSWASVDASMKLWASAGAPKTVPAAANIDLGNGSFVVSEYVAFITTDNVEFEFYGIVFPEKGVYFASGPDNFYIAGIASADSDTPEITWDGNIETIKTIDPKYIPSELNEIILPSSTSGSTKKFKITVDDSGTLSATEVT